MRVEKKVCARCGKRIAYKVADAMLYVRKLNLDDDDADK